MFFGHLKCGWPWMLAHLTVVALAPLSASAQVSPGIGYIIVNAGTGLVLDVSGTANGAQVRQSPLSSAISETWFFTPIPNSSEYTLHSENSGYVLDVPQGSFVNGVSMQLWLANGYPQQNWILSAVPGTSFFNIKNAYTGLVLDIPGGSTASGTVVQQWSANNFPQQNWELLPIQTPGSIITYFIMNVGTGLALEHTTRQVLEEPSSTMFDEQWQLFPVPNSPYFTIGSPTSFSAIGGTTDGGAYGVLDVPGGATNNGALIQWYPPTKTPQQNWLPIPIVGTPYYTILNQRSGLVLDATGDARIAGTQIQQWQANGGQAQQWMLVSTMQPSSGNGGSGCSFNSCNSQCNQAYSSCTANSQSGASCSQNAMIDLNVCNSTCDQTTQNGVVGCQQSCIIFSQNNLNACQAGSQYVTQACSAEQQGCQTSCNQCPNP